MNTKHIFTSDQKLEWWGSGEWVEEPDFVEFEHKKIKCKIIRIVSEEPYAKESSMFGGYLCGYVSVPSEHPYYQKIYENMDIQVHGGLTYGECNDSHWIGFDCAHSYDYIPSLENIKKTAEWMKDCRHSEEELKKKYNLENSPIFNKTYKNINYCIEQCKSMAEQLNEIKTSL